MFMDIIIEIPKGSHIKYEFDKNLNMLRVDRILPNHMRYPFHYGYIPNTLAPDNDPYDVILLSHHELVPDVVINARIIGCLLMEDEEGEDPKILMVPSDKVDQDWKDITDICDVPKYNLDRIEHFFKHYKDLEKHKFVNIKKWLNKDETNSLYKITNNII